MALLTEWIPVNPLLNEAGEFVSLKNYSDKPLKPNPLEGADPGTSEFGKEYKLNCSVSSKLEVAAIGGIESKFGTTTFIHDSIIYRQSRAANGNDIIKGTWWGCGLRLKVTVKNLEFGLNATWSGIAAAAQMGYADAEFEIESIGIAEPEIFKLLPSPSDLNLKTYEQILEAGDAIRTFLHNADPSKLVFKPLRIQVDIPDTTSIDPIADDRHLIFTYQKARQRRSLKQAKNEAIEKNLDPRIVVGFYKDLFQITDEGKKPSFEQAREAREWLDR